MIPQLTKIKAAHPDAIILYTNAAAASVIAKNYQQLGMETAVVACHAIPTPDFMRLAGKIVEGRRWIIFGFKDRYADRLAPDDPYRKNLWDPFKKALHEKYGKIEVSPFHLNQHDAMRMVVEALKIAGTDDRAALRDALEKVRYQGLIGTFAYSPADHDGQSGEFLEPLTVRDGELWPYKKQ